MNSSQSTSGEPHAILAALTKLASMLSPYDPIDLLAITGGLQIMPENASCAIRLEALAHTIASLPDQPSMRPHISGHRLSRICNEEPLGQGFIAANEDPCSNAFTEAFTFIGGSYVVFPGIVEEATFTLRHLSKALFQYPDPFPNETFLGEAKAVLYAALVLSNTVAQRADIDRGLESDVSSSSGVRVPEARRLERLKAAVTFTLPELQTIFKEQESPLVALDKLTLACGQVSLDQYDIETGDLLQRPVIRSGNQFIVALPGMLLAAARNAVLQLAANFGVIEELAYRYHEAVWTTVAHSLKHMKNRRVPITLPAYSDVPCVSDAYFTLDMDKLLYVLVITDTLHGYNSEQMMAQWPTDHLPALIEQRLRAIHDDVAQSQPQSREILSLVLVQSIDRWSVVGFNDPEGSVPTRSLTMTAADLETLSFLEAGKQLALWQYARAIDRLGGHAKIHAIGELARFGLYRENGYSFYLSDEACPDMIVADSGYAYKLRYEVIRQRDCHAAPSYRTGYVTEVTTLYDTRAVPIYVPTSLMGQQVTLLVEGAPTLIWIIGLLPEDDEKQSARSIFAFQFADTIAYWLWQFTPSLRSALQKLSPGHAVIRLRLHLVPSDDWEQSKVRGVVQEPSSDSISVNADSRQALVTVTLQASICQHFQGGDNHGERLLMRYVLEGIRSLMPETERPHLTDEAISTLLDRHAPLGVKKKLLILHVSDAPDLDSRGLPDARFVEPADIDDLLDALGTYLTQVEGIAQGPVPPDQRTTVLQKVVKFFYRELERTVAELEPMRLLEWLVTRHEAITHDIAEHHLTIPTRLACFSNLVDMIDNLRKELPKRYKAAMAGRFVIEYVTACPPTGTRPISLACYDHLLALASLIIQYGFESDLIHGHLADISLELLPSGRLGADHALYERAQTAYLGSVMAGEIGQASSDLERRWQNLRRSYEQPVLSAQIDAAAVAEFGESITDLVAFLGEIVALSLKLGEGTVMIPRDEFITQLALGLAWKADRVRAVLDVFTLRPRTDFLHPPTPFKPEDTYPWRFNRALSYLRRPLLEREQNGRAELVWGMRQVYLAIGYLTDLCTSGRLRAGSNEMVRLMGEICSRQGEAFNDYVATQLEQISGLIVQRRVKKIGNLRVEERGLDLGDLDILVADPKSRRLLVIECKDLAVARTPHDMANELASLFLGQHGNRSFVEKHQRRTNWVRDHLVSVLAFLNLPTDRGRPWKVEASVVVDQELFTPYLYKSPIRVVTAEQLVAELLVLHS